MNMMIGLMNMFLWTIKTKRNFKIKLLNNEIIRDALLKGIPFVLIATVF